MQAILASQKDKPLDEVAELADVIMDSILPAAVSSVIQSQVSNTSLENRVLARVEELVNHHWFHPHGHTNSHSSS